MARVKYEMTDPKINEMFDTLFSGHALVVSSSGDVVATLVEKVIEISGNKKVVVPAATEANKGKEYIVYFSANAKTGGGIVDDKTPSATVIGIDDGFIRLLTLEIKKVAYSRKGKAMSQEEYYELTRERRPKWVAEKGRINSTISLPMGGARFGESR